MRTATTSRSRALFDSNLPHGVAYYPFYTVQEVCAIVALSDDKVRSLFRSLRYGPILEPASQDKGKRRWRQLFVPYETLIAYIERHLKVPDNYPSPHVAERRLALLRRIARTGGNTSSSNELSL